MKKKPTNSYLKYSGMAIQMGLIISLFSFGGYYLDTLLQTKPILIVVGSLSGVALSLYIFIKLALTDD